MDPLVLNDKSSSPTLIVVIVEMNVYMPLLQTLPENQRILAKEQFTVLQGLKHPHLCRIDEVTGSGASLSVSCEFLNISLQVSHRSRSLSWNNEELAKQFLGVVAGLGKVHGKVAITQGFAHGRLSLEALYLDYAGKNVKIVGFGGGNNEPEQYAKVCSQLPLQYRSPEIKQGQPFNLCKADMWALGVCFLQLATHQDLTGQESIEEVASRAASLGPPLASLLRLVLTVERERPDFLDFKSRSGYCPQCWNNIDQEGLSLCEMCPQGSRGINPLAIRALELSAQPSSARIAVPQVAQPKYRQVNHESSPEPAKCLKCPNLLTKINEKDICRLCLSKSSVKPPVQSPQPVVPNPNPGPLVQSKLTPFVPQKPGSVPGPNMWVPKGQEPYKPAPPYSDPPSRGFPNLGGVPGGRGRESRSCIGCRKWLPEIPSYGSGFEGYDELCPKCAEAQAIGESMLTSYPS